MYPAGDVFHVPGRVHHGDVVANLWEPASRHCRLVVGRHH